MQKPFVFKLWIMPEYTSKHAPMILKLSSLYSISGSIFVSFVYFVVEPAVGCSRCQTLFFRNGGRTVSASTRLPWISTSTRIPGAPASVSR